MLRAPSLTCALMVLLLYASTSSAQSLRITAVDSSTGSPLGGLLAAVRDESGRQVAQGVLSPDGRSTLALPGVGAFTVQLRRVGYRPYTSARIVVASPTVHAVVLRATLPPINLPTVTRQEPDLCGIRETDQGREGRHIVDRWEQLRTALTLSDLARDGAEMQVGVEVRHFATRYASDRVTELRHTVVPAPSHAARPFRTLDAEDLSTYGYVRHHEKESTFAAPDERALLSEQFALEHCFRLIQGERERSGLTGLAFTPARNRSVPEVAGTIWSDAATGALRLLEFWYVDPNLPREARGEGKAGGEVHFALLPGGVWGISAWRLRMPQVTRRTGSSLPLLRFLDIGAVAILDSNSPETARIVRRTDPGGVQVLVRDASGTGPLTGAIVTLSQLPDSAAAHFEGGDDEYPGPGAAPNIRLTTTTDGSGAAHLTGVPPGVYEVRFAHASLEADGVEPPAAEAVIRSDSVVRVALTALPRREITDRCGRPTLGAVYGLVREGPDVLSPDTRPSRAAVVIVRWSSGERRATANGRGEFTVCDVPRDVPLTIHAAVVRSAAGRPVARLGVDRSASSPEHLPPLGAWHAVYRSILVPVAVSH